MERRRQGDEGLLRQGQGEGPATGRSSCRPTSRPRPKRGLQAALDAARKLNGRPRPPRVVARHRRGVVAGSQESTCSWRPEEAVGPNAPRRVSARRWPATSRRRSRRERPAGTGRRRQATPMRQPADGARVSQPSLGMHHFGRGLVGTPSELWQARRTTDAPRVARLSRRALRRVRLVGEDAAPRDHAVVDVYQPVQRPRTTRNQSHKPNPATLCHSVFRTPHSADGRRRQLASALWRAT